MRVADVAVSPDRESPLGFLSWLRELRALTACTLNPPPYPSVDLPRGDGRVVLLIPGFLSGDWAMIRLRAFLESLDYRVEVAGLVFNAGPTAVIMTRIERTLLRLAAKTGPINVIGQSLGGVFARELAVRHPELVDRVITLCSPARFPVTTPLAPLVTIFAPLHDREWTMRGTFVDAHNEVPITAIYSEQDGIVDWRQCLIEVSSSRKNIRVRGAHTTIGSNPDAQIAVATALSA
jgi:hypothetical protein